VVVNDISIILNGLQTKLPSLPNTVNRTDFENSMRSEGYRADRSMASFVDANVKRGGIPSLPPPEQPHISYIIQIN